MKAVTRSLVSTEEYVSTSVARAFPKEAALAKEFQAMVKHCDRSQLQDPTSNHDDGLPAEIGTLFPAAAFMVSNFLGFKGPQELRWFDLLSTDAALAVATLMARHSAPVERAMRTTRVIETMTVTTFSLNPNQIKQSLTDWSHLYHDVHRVIAFQMAEHLQSVLRSHATENAIRPNPIHALRMQCVTMLLNKFVQRHDLVLGATTWREVVMGSMFACRLGVSSSEASCFGIKSV